MKTVYIPVSSLNFNNIFASESVSPASFYHKRNFGYKSFEKINELRRFDNSILLYDKCPVFEIKSDGRDNYPMIIRIKLEFDIRPIKTVQDVSIYQYMETIYLNPFTTKIFFLTEEARKISLLAAERSLTTKMTYLYERFGCFRVLPKGELIETFLFSPNFNEGIEDTSDKESAKQIDLDQRINRLKGFLYSYLIGANKSLNPELILIKKSTREIGNVISAVINSPDRTLTKYQEDDLLKFANNFELSFNKIDKESKLLETRVKQYGSELSITSLKEIIRDRYLTDRIKSLFNIFEVVSDSIRLESVMTRINDKVHQLEKEYFADKQKLVLSEEVSLANYRVTRFEVENSDFYTAVVNEYLSYDFQKESRLSVATFGIKLLKAMYEEKNINWSESIQREYFNELLANIQGKGSFLVSKNSNQIHQSFALFVLNKEKDEIEKLEASLISNTIYNYNFSFGLWGTLNGFANMPKTLTNELFLSNDLDYITLIYKYIFKQLHSIELEGNLEKTQIKKQADEAKLEEPKNVVNKDDDKATTAKLDNRDIRRELKDCKLSPEQVDSICEIYEKNHHNINKRFFDSVAKIRNIGKKKIDKIKEAVGYEKSDVSKITPAETSLFNELKPELGKELFNDSSVFFHIEMLVPQKLRKSFKTDLDWFQSEYMKGATSKYYSKALKDNPAVIDSFERYISKKKYARQLEIKSIIRKLRELYLR